MPKKPEISEVKQFGKSVDFGKTALDYSTFRAGFPSAFFDRLFTCCAILSGLRALDVGTGTGTVARGLATRGLNVVGIDPAQPLMDQALALDRAAGVTVEYRQGQAENLDQADESFDVVTAGQCWHWFDRPKAASEAFRVLKPGGLMVIAHFDWLPYAGNVVEATENLILKYNPAWALSGGVGMYPDWLTDMVNAGFYGIETHSFDVEQSYSPDGWCGRIRASAGIKASLDAPAIEAFDAELHALLQKKYPQDPLMIPHRIWFVSGRRPV